MIVKNITLQQFRCFQESSFSFDSRVVVIEGANGSGKSSLLEAIHYSCYLRSFRTHLNKDMVKLGTNYFFLNVTFSSHDMLNNDVISIGFSDTDGKVVKYNNKAVQSYKDLVSFFKIVTLSAEDIDLVQGSPELRRDFLNYALLLIDPSLTTHLRQYKQILDQRNSIIINSYGKNLAHSEEFAIWTKQLWEVSVVIRAKRIEYLTELTKNINTLLTTYFFEQETKDLSIELNYISKNMGHGSFEEFWDVYKNKHVATEQSFNRSLFGIHLDDFAIIFHNKKARTYASRGQQKLLVLLIKLSQLQQLSATGEPGVLLLDDFMTDFDAKKIEMAISALHNLKHQMFLSCPVNPSSFLNKLEKDDVSYIKF